MTQSPLEDPTSQCHHTGVRSQHINLGDTIIQSLAMSNSGILSLGERENSGIGGKDVCGLEDSIYRKAGLIVCSDSSSVLALLHAGCCYQEHGDTSIGDSASGRTAGGGAGGEGSRTQVHKVTRGKAWRRRMKVFQDLKRKSFGIIWEEVRTENQFGEEPVTVNFVWTPFLMVLENANVGFELSLHPFGGQTVSQHSTFPSRLDHISLSGFSG